MSVCVRAYLCICESTLTPLHPQAQQLYRKAVAAAAQQHSSIGEAAHVHREQIHLLYGKLLFETAGGHSGGGYSGGSGGEEGDGEGNNRISAAETAFRAALGANTNINACTYYNPSCFSQ